MDKYKLHTVLGHNYYQIQALRDIPSIGVLAGMFGGFVTSEKNLSQEGNGWVVQKSFVLGDAQVLDGYVGSDSMILGKTIMHGGHVTNSSILGESIIHPGSTIQDSQLKDVVVENNVKIVESDLKNVMLNPFGEVGQLFYKVYFHGKRKTTITNAQNWYNIHLDFEVVNISGSLVFRNCTLQGLRFFVWEEAHIEYVVIKENTEKGFSILVGRTPEKSRTVLKGKSKAEPLQLAGTDLDIASSYVNGAVSILGCIFARNLTATDFSSINMNGELSDVVVSECASIHLDEGESHRIEGITLREDDMLMVT